MKKNLPSTLPALPTPLIIALTGLALSITSLSLPAQRNRTAPSEIGASPQAVGEAGIAWYTTWDNALAEAKRSNRPIFFMAAAATCNGIPGVF